MVSTLTFRLRTCKCSSYLISVYLLLQERDSIVEAVVQYWVPIQQKIRKGLIYSRLQTGEAWKQGLIPKPEGLEVTWFSSHSVTTWEPG